MKKQISLILWLEASDEQVDDIERGVRYLIKGLNPTVTLNVIKKEDKLNIPNKSPIAGRLSGTYASLV